MCLDGTACARRQPGGGTALFQDFVTMPMSEERTLEGPLLFVCTARAQGAISYSSARVVAHPSVPATWAEERLPMGVGPCSVSGLPPHPTTCNNTSLSPKGQMVVQEAPQRVRPSLGKGERNTEQTDLS